MKFILFIVIFGSNGSVDGGLALTSQQILFSNQKQCEAAKQQVLNYSHVEAKTGLNVDIGKFVVKATCFTQG